MAKMRTIQRPHESDKFTLAQARVAWRRVEGTDGPAGEKRAAVARPQPVRSGGGGPRLAAERGRGG